MQTNKILSASLIDLVFEGRYKDYGAYELRKNYSKRINRALLVTLVIASLICASVFLANAGKKNNSVFVISDDVELTELVEKPVEPLPEPETPREVEPVRTEAYTAPIIMPTDVIDRPMPPIEAMDSAVIGLDKIKGPPDDGFPRPQDLDSGKRIVQQRVEPESDEPFRTVEVDAKFVGNWRKFLESTLNASIPIDNEAPPGSYTVVVEFVVNKEGMISDVVALTNHGYGMETEAIRAIKKSKVWEPAIMNGHQVKAYKRQPIVFQVLED